MEIWSHRWFTVDDFSYLLDILVVVSQFIGEIIDITYHSYLRSVQLWTGQSHNFINNLEYHTCQENSNLEISYGFCLFIFLNNWPFLALYSIITHIKTGRNYMKPLQADFLNFLYIYIFAFLFLSWHWVCVAVELILMEDRFQCFLHNQCHCCWWPGDAKDPGHQQLWYWPVLPRIFQLRHQKS